MGRRYGNGKQLDIWYLTEPMDSNYIPTKKEFKEISSFGILQGSIIFIESKQEKLKGDYLNK